MIGYYDSRRKKKDIVVARDKSAGGQLPADCLKQDFYSH